MKLHIPMHTFYVLPLCGFLTGVSGGLAYVGYKLTIHIAERLLS